MARKWTSIKEYASEILRLREQGKTRQEVADALGLNEPQIKEFLKRHYKKQRLGITIPKQKGRPRKHPPTTQREMILRIKVLEREVAVLRSFLHAAGRM